MSQIVLRDVEVLEFANSRENHFFEERGEAIIVDEIHSKAETFKRSLLGLSDALDDSFEALLTDSVMTDIQKLDIFVDFQKVSYSSGAVYVNCVLKEI